MGLRGLILLAVRVSIFLTVLAIGFGASRRDLGYLMHRPRQLQLALCSMFVIVPAAAILLIAAFSLKPAVEIALIALALSPVPPVLPRTMLKAGGRKEYAISLLAIASVVAVVFVPAGIQLIGIAAKREMHLPPTAIAKVELITVLVPLLVGILVRQLAPRLGQRLARPTSRASTVLLAAAALPMLLITLPSAMRLIGNGTLAALIVFELVGLASGHLLGGPDPSDRTVLALASSSRHPGVALTVATMAFPTAPFELSAIVLYLLTSAVLTIVYLVWRRHSDQRSTARSGRGSKGFSSVRSTGHR
ncbi:MAG TPA: bile acid:sodium symporter [Gemmatimonadaceae bacterium]|nr:bile acid:sodium symporter [Gemmatimonadaceae bacterium]